MGKTGVHELPIVTEIIRIVNGEAKERGLTRITSITLLIGELSTVMDESVQMYFELLAAGTPCEHARLIFEHAGARLRCEKCGHEFEHVHGFDCPLCGSPAVLIKGTGREMTIKSIESE